MRVIRFWATSLPDTHTHALTKINPLKITQSGRKKMSTLLTHISARMITHIHWNNQNKCDKAIERIYICICMNVKCKPPQLYPHITLHYTNARKKNKLTKCQPHPTPIY